MCQWVWLVVGPEGLSSISVFWLAALWPIRRPDLTVAIKIVTHSLWASAGHLEIPVMFYLSVTHTLIHTRTHTNITFLPCLCLSRKLLHISSLLRNTMSGWRRRRKPGEGRESRQWFPHTYKNTVSLNQSVAHIGLISMTERLCLIKTLVMYVDCLQRVLLADLLYM